MHELVSCFQVFNFTSPHTRKNERNYFDLDQRSGRDIFGFHNRILPHSNHQQKLFRDFLLRQPQSSCTELGMLCDEGHLKKQFISSLCCCCGYHKNPRRCSGSLNKNAFKCKTSLFSCGHKLQRVCCISVKLYTFQVFHRLSLFCERISFFYVVSRSLETFVECVYLRQPQLVDSHFIIIHHGGSYRQLALPKIMKKRKTSDGKHETKFQKQKRRNRSSAKHGEQSTFSLFLLSCSGSFLWRYKITQPHQTQKESLLKIISEASAVDDFDFECFMQSC